MQRRLEYLCWNRSDDFATLRPAPTSAQDGLDPLQLALVLILVDPIVYAHIQMTCFVWWLYVPCVCMFTVRFDCDVCVWGV